MKQRPWVSAVEGTRARCQQLFAARHLFLLLSSSSCSKRVALALQQRALVARWLVLLLREWSHQTFPSGPKRVKSRGWDWACLGNEEAAPASEPDPADRTPGRPRVSSLARHWSDAPDVALEEKHAVSMKNGLLEKKRTWQNL